ncbi:MAG: biopolymer transporter ExbD [Aquificae bacterium]|nr:biopolymer transporter ExbD [Aquificota bacterium]
MNLRKKIRFREEERSYIDVVPLVDTLLAVFLFLAVLAFQSPETFIALKLPVAETGEKASLKALKVQITKEGKILLRGKEVTEEELKKALEGSGAEFLILEADEDVRHGLVVKVMDLARKSGIENVVIAVRKKR